MSTLDWTTREWNNDHYPRDQLSGKGDTWGIRWRGTEKMRHDSYLKLIDHRLHDEHPLKILDIGCGLCDFTEKAWRLNPQNEFWGFDISDNAIAWAKERFPHFHLDTGVLPECPFDVRYDVVFCLEVLCYGSEIGRKNAIKNISDWLTPSGTLLFAGVLDGGRQHHTENEVRALLEEDFQVREVIYNYWSPYRRLIGKPLDTLAGYLSAFRKVMSMTDAEASEWMSRMPQSPLRRIAVSLRSLNPLTDWAARGAGRFIELCLAWRHPPVVANWISRILTGSERADEIVILADRKH